MGNRQRPTRKTRRRPPNLQQEELRGQAPSFPLRQTTEKRMVAAPRLWEAE
jgi:hypothetical protein